MNRHSKSNAGFFGPMWARIFVAHSDVYRAAMRGEAVRHVREIPDYVVTPEQKKRRKKRRAQRLARRKNRS